MTIAAASIGPGVKHRAIAGESANGPPHTGTKGRRKRRLEASDKPLATPLPGSVRNGAFSSIEPIPCKATIGGFDSPTMVWPERNFHAGPIPGALQGDDYQLDYYPDGYPKLPACLDRRRKPEPLAEAA